VLQQTPRRAHNFTVGGFQGPGVHIHSSEEELRLVARMQAFAQNLIELSVTAERTSAIWFDDIVRLIPLIDF